jgi:DNA mismatch repair protein MutS2
VDFSHAEGVLELRRALEQIAPGCNTTLGVGYLLAIRPTFDRGVIEARLRKTEEARTLIESDPPPPYGSVRDVAEPVRLAAKGAIVPGAQLFRVAETLGGMQRLRAWLDRARTGAPSLGALGQAIPWLEELKDRLAASVAEDGEVLDSASPELSRLRSQRAALHRRIVERLQSLVHGSLRDYLQEPLYTMREGRYVVPVKAGFRGKVKGIVHDASATGQTVYVEPEAILGESNRLREIEAEEREEVERILKDLSGAVGDHSEEILTGLEAVAEIDAHIAMATSANDRSAGTPRIREGHFLSVVEGHHPLLDREISVAVSVSVGGSNGSLLITGPNTGGKTVTLKLLGLYALLLGCGAHPPAERIEYGPFTGVFADIGDEQSVEQSLSTFSGHLRNIAHMLRHAKEGALALLDEVGAGTDPAEGSALARAVLDTLLDAGVVIAATTHYGELKEFAQRSGRIRPAAMEFDVETLRPTYRLIPGASGQSHALEIAQRFGIPQGVLRRAEEAMGDEVKQRRRRDQEVDDVLLSARRAREEAERAKAEVIQEREMLQRERQKLQEKFARLRERLQKEVEQAIRDARDSYRQLLEQAKRAPGAAEPTAPATALHEAHRVVERLREAELLLEPFAAPVETLSVGDSVRIRGTGRVGEVHSIKGDEVVVLIAGKRFTVPLARLEMAAAPPTESKPSSSSASIARRKVETISPELTIRKMRAEEALEALDQYLDDVALAGLESVRIVHGRGDGVLRRLVRERLAARKDVREFHDAPPASGGDGVTVVHFR